MELLGRVERYLRRSGMAATRFGRESMRDPRFVFDLRRGREPRAPTLMRVSAYLNDREEGRGR
jgi:2,4-dienoyl-CoA reductase-like NADH-dependent reductase (Old Yellow Enzyme family)